MAERTIADDILERCNIYAVKTKTRRLIQMNEFDMVGSQQELRSTKEINVEDILKERRARKSRELADIDEAIEILAKQPELLKTLNLLRRVGV